MESDEMHKYITPLEECLNNSTMDPVISDLHCNRTWDTIMCWEPIEAGHVAKQPCPSIFTAIPGSMVYKTCQKDGTWAKPEFWRGFGYSDYSECVHHLNVIHDVFDIEKEDLKMSDSLSVQPMPAVIIVSVSILALSLTCLLMSILALHFVLPKTVIQAAQYKVSRNLFLSVMFQAIVTMTRKILLLSDHYNTGSPVSKISVLCEVLITAEGYADTVTYMWLLIQTHHLQLKTRSGTLCTSGHMTYCLIGWGLPVIPTAIWSVTLAVSHKVTCWPEYSHMPILWVLTGSKLLMMIASGVCLTVSIWLLSRNYEILSKSCCLRRTFFETKVFSLYFVYILISLVTTLIITHVASPISPWEYVSSVMTSLRGFVLSSLFWAFNMDIRKIMKKKVRRQSRQELVRTSSDDNAVQVQNA